MRTLLSALACAVLLSCGGEPPTETTGPPAFSELIVNVPDSTVFVGDTLPVELLAVLETGDTVPAPDSAALEVPTGFTLLSGRRVLPVDEAAGTIVGRLNPTDSTQVRSAVDLTAHVPWRANWRCYGEEAVRDGETVRVDSMLGRSTDAHYVYRDSTQMEGRFRGSIRGIRFWEDGVVDTVHQDSSSFLSGVRQARVDTLVTNALPAGYIPARDSSTAERPIYEASPPGLCGSSWDSGGAFVLHPGA